MRVRGLCLFPVNGLASILFFSVSSRGEKVIGKGVSRDVVVAFSFLGNQGRMRRFIHGLVAGVFSMDGCAKVLMFCPWDVGYGSVERLSETVRLRLWPVRYHIVRIRNQLSVGLQLAQSFWCA